MTYFDCINAFDIICLPRLFTFLKSILGFVMERQVRRKALVGRRQMLRRVRGDQNQDDEDVQGAALNAQDYQPVFEVTMGESSPRDQSLSSSSSDIGPGYDSFESRRLERLCNDVCELSGNELAVAPIGCVSVKQKLTLWAIYSRTPHIHVNAILRIFRPFFPDLPLDARTLLNTPRQNCLVSVNPGEYFHFGISFGVIRSLHPSEVIDGTIIEYFIGIDGIPITKSKRGELWPILGLTKNKKYSTPFVIGLYFGSRKPTDVNVFLKHFVDEMLEIQDGIRVGTLTLKVKLLGFICDAPARAFIKCIKGHSGYNSCERCVVHGDHLGRVVFLEMSCPERNDASFKTQEDESHHLGKSDLEKLNDIDMVKDFPLDYMHLVCLGVVRKMLNWFKKGSYLVRLRSLDIKRISNFLMNISCNIPCEFARLPRSLEDLPLWKATEFRQFLLYTGVVVLKKVLNPQLYSHFLSLHVAMRILLTPALCQEKNQFANDLLREFVRSSVVLYGNEFLSYNVHNLIHLASDAMRYGHLDRISAFPFENMLMMLKAKLRKKGATLQQLINRKFEDDVNNKTIYIKDGDRNLNLKSVHSGGPMVGNLKKSNVIQYEKLYFDGQKLTLTNPNNCVILNDGQVVVIKNICVKNDGEILLVCRAFLKLSNLYYIKVPGNVPENYYVSSSLDIFKVSDLSHEYEVYNLGDVKFKAVKIPLFYTSKKHDFAIFPLLCEPNK